MTTTEAETKVEAPKVEPTDAKEQTDDKAGEQNSSAPGSPTKKTETLKPVVTVHKKDFEKDVIYLYQFVRSPTIPSLSACCLKVENWLRMVGLQYENVDHKLRYKSKKGQLPFVELNGKEVDDADAIIREFSKSFEKDLDSGLTEDQKTLSHAFMSMLNNHTGWIVRWWRYNNPQEFLETAQLDIKRTFNSRFPNSILNFVFKLGFKKHLRDSLGYGIGRFTQEEVIESAKQDIKALSTYLGKKDYFFGKEPHSLDCVAFAHLAQIIYVPFGGLKEWMETDAANLLALVDRIKAKYWPDWDEMCSSLELNTHLPKKEVPPEAAAPPADATTTTTEAKTDAKSEEDTKKAEKEKQQQKKKEEKEKKKKEKKEKKSKKDSKEKSEEAPKEGKDAEAAKETQDAPNGGEAPKAAEVKAE